MKFTNWASSRDEELARLFSKICMQMYPLGTPVALATRIAPPSAPEHDNSSDSVAEHQPIGGAKKRKDRYHAWHRKKPKENSLEWSLPNDPNKPRNKFDTEPSDRWGFPKLQQVIIQIQELDEQTNDNDVKLIEMSN